MICYTLLKLRTVEKDSLFENTALQFLIEYLWKRCRGFHYWTSLLFSLNMFLFSIYSVIKEEHRIIEFLILVITMIFVVYEFGQFAHSSLKQYFLNAWNYTDILGNCFIIAKIGLMWVGYSIESEESQWVTAFALFFGYIKWVSYFTIFDSTRRLVRLITQTVKDMKSFVMVLGFIIVGFSFIFVQFQENDGDETLGDTLLYTYSILYGNYSFDEIKFPELLFLLLVAFALSVVLMNMLIAIMGDTYGKVQERLKFSDSQAKLEMILETIHMKRAFIKFGLYCFKEKEASLKNTYLYVVHEKDAQVQLNSNEPEDKVDTQNKSKNKDKGLQEEKEGDKYEKAPGNFRNESLIAVILEMKAEIQSSRHEMLKIRAEIESGRDQILKIINKLIKSEELNQVLSSEPRELNMKQVEIKSNKNQSEYF